MRPDPARSRKIVDLEGPTTSTHAGLWLDRFLARQTWGPGGKEDKAESEKARAALLDGVMTIKKPDGYEAAFGAWERDLKAEPPRVALARGRTVGRLLVGAGQKNPAEFGITLHRTWGLPYIPGSSLKGIAAWGAHHGLGADFQRRDNSAEARPGGPNAFDALFGDVEEQGAVIFHDAWLAPGSAPGLHRDVLTVHHPDYYQGRGAPSDTDSPTPVGFVSAQGEFLFALELHPALDPVEHGHWLRAAWEALRWGLERHGVGAKTNVGYGRVELPAWDGLEAQVQARKTAAARAEQAEREAQAQRRAALPVAERLADAAKVEGVEAIVGWLTGRRDEIPGLSGTREEVEEAARLLRGHGRGGGLAASTRSDWQAWVKEALRPPSAPATPASPPATPAAPRPKVSLPDEDLARILKKARDINAAVNEILRRNPDAETVERAARLLLEKDAQPGHLKRLREGR